MTSTAYADADFRQPHVPPATPPVIDSNASASDAATLAQDNRDSEAPCSRLAQFDRGREDEAIFAERGGGGDRDFPGEQPDEVVPGQGDSDWPERSPDEVAPGQGDFDRPDSSPMESPPQPDTAPAETPAPD